MVVRKLFGAGDGALRPSGDPGWVYLGIPLSGVVRLQTSERLSLDLRLRRTLRQGRATVQIVARDASGNRTVLSRVVQVPAGA